MEKGEGRREHGEACPTQEGENGRGEENKV